MNVVATTVSTGKTAEHSSSSSSSSTVAKDEAKTFKDELGDAKTQEANATAVKETEAQDAEANKSKMTEEQSAKISQDNLLQQVSKDKLLAKQEDALKSAEDADIITSLTELNSKIATINGLKTGFDKEIEGVKSKTEDKVDGNFCQTIKMDNKDVSFFLSLTDNQQMTAQASQLQVQNGLSGVDFTSVKSEATQKTVQISQTLLDSLNESAKTNKPFRIDFDSDVSVIMKVDKDGVLSANFIPGSAAVETYLKNNIAGLRQTFDSQNLSYNELSYSGRRKDEEQQEKQQENREKENE